jgi:SAM-dependent methyltransferase
MTDAAAMAAVFDRVASSYETVGPPFFEHFGIRLVERAGARRGDRVLDLAAGTGALALPALAAAGATGSLLAIDLSAAMVSRLTEWLSASGHPDATAVVGDIAHLDREPASADVVLCGFGLFFLPDPPAALRQWRQLLAPGGRLAVSTWARADPVFEAVRDELARLGVNSRSRGEAYDDGPALLLALRRAGLTDVRVSSVSLDIVLADVGELLRWSGTHGARVWLDQLDDEQIASLTSALFERWPGEVAMTWQAHLAVGMRSAS